MKKLVVITGGTSGLGFEIAKQLSNWGEFDVCLIGKSKEKLNTALSHLPKSVFGFNGDVSNEEFVKNVFNTLAEKGYNIEYLFNCAGIGLFGDPDSNDATKTESIIKTNLIGTILTTNYAIPLMEKHGGKIVNILSTAALKGNPLESVYCASKWGVRGFTESLKEYFKQSKIKVVGVYPGGMNTDFWNNSRDYVSFERSSKFMNPADVANIIINNVTENSVSVADIVIERP